MITAVLPHYIIIKILNILFNTFHNALWLLKLFTLVSKEFRVKIVPKASNNLVTLSTPDSFKRALQLGYLNGQLGLIINANSLSELQRKKHINLIPKINTLSIYPQFIDLLNSLQKPFERIEKLNQLNLNYISFYKSPPTMLSNIDIEYVTVSIGFQSTITELTDLVDCISKFQGLNRINFTLNPLVHIPSGIFDKLRNLKKLTFENVIVDQDILISMTESLQLLNELIMTNSVIVSPHDDLTPIVKSIFEYNRLENLVLRLKSNDNYYNYATLIECLNRNHSLTSFNLPPVTNVDISNLPTITNNTLQYTEDNELLTLWSCTSGITKVFLMEQTLPIKNFCSPLKLYHNNIREVTMFLDSNYFSTVTRILEINKPNLESISVTGTFYKQNINDSEIEFFNALQYNLYIKTLQYEFRVSSTSLSKFLEFNHPSLTSLAIRDFNEWDHFDSIAISLSKNKNIQRFTLSQHRAEYKMNPNTYLTHIQNILESNQQLIHLKISPPSEFLLPTQTQIEKFKNSINNAKYGPNLLNLHVFTKYDRLNKIIPKHIQV
ncbi:hypothetical protein DLAC_04393 [Tieghemostelium lacteum]|uniref:Uncharacterized protein n=1 Tax=Tieghemostelium lacteum TaxID=361077 RepID=A0A151ZJF5_TIELA|nr:hypothetical protein DLAC_04393 [Tieghemostelium lacteum]|eukprot:KYQ94113.1 hypothetical protein DLAC_04393 [Tieghemostelium lacteum]